jgi:hypothetical protein
MAGRRGRPRTDRIRNVEKIAELLMDDPTLSANAVARLARIRRQEAIRIVRLLRRLTSRFPKPGSGT